MKTNPQSRAHGYNYESQRALRSLIRAFFIIIGVVGAIATLIVVYALNPRKVEEIPLWILLPVGFCMSVYFCWEIRWWWMREYRNPPPAEKGGGTYMLEDKMRK